MNLLDLLILHDFSFYKHFVITIIVMTTYEYDKSLLNSYDFTNVIALTFVSSS